MITLPDRALVGFVTSGCYKATVNESETITAAKAVWARVFAAKSLARFFPALTAVERS
jgi:hypothetical protein